MHSTGVALFEAYFAWDLYFESRRWRCVYSNAASNTVRRLWRAVGVGEMSQACPKVCFISQGLVRISHHKNLVVSGFQVVVMGVLVIIPGRLLSFRNILRSFHDPLSMGPLKVWCWLDSLVKRETPSPTKLYIFLFFYVSCFYFMNVVLGWWFGIWDRFWK